MGPSLRLAALVALCIAPLGATSAPTTAPTAPRAHAGDGWAIAAPAEWRAFAPLPAGKVLHLIGDAKPGMPPVDGTLSAVQVGLSVERFAAGGATPADRVRRDLAELTAGRFVPLGEPKVDAIALADGTPASRLTARLLRRDIGRASFYAKVYAAAPDGAQLVATSFVTCGRPGVRSIEAIRLPEFAAAHAATLVLDPAKLDVAPLDAAYRRYAWDGARALAFTSRVNDAIDQKQYGSAIAGFRMLLKKWDAIPAAHNGLA